MFHKYGNFEGCISGANTVSSNRSFSYAIFKRRIHDALTTRFVFKNSFIFFLFILLLLLFYIYIPRAKAIYYHQYGPSDVFFSPFLYYIYIFFFFLSICHGSKHLFLLRIEAHDLIDSSALLTFFPRVRSIRRFYKVVSFDLRKAPSTDSFAAFLFDIDCCNTIPSLPFYVTFALEN